MSGFVAIIGPCIACHRTFSFNPHRVPSTSAITGEREPLCRDCFDELNRRRVENGLEPFPLNPDAYDAIPAEQF
jgi:hypothetical protein